MNRRLCLFAYVVLLAFLAVVPAASALDVDKDLIQCRIDRWGQSNGLIPRAISSIAQTRDGYIWLGTESGLVRFDGVTFSYFPFANAFEDITALTATRDGGLWYGTNSTGFGQFIDGRFVRRDPGGPDWSLTCGITETRAGDIWVSAEGKYLAYVVHNGQTRPILKFQQDLPSDCWVMKGIVEGDGGVMWGAIPNEGLIALYPDGSHKIFRMSKPGKVVYAASIARDTQGNLWLAAAELGLWRFRAGRFRQFTSRDGLPSSTVQCVYCDREGSVWIGTKDGICRYFRGRFSTFDTSDVYGNRGVSSIMEDRERNLWVVAGHELIRFANTKLTPVVPQTGGVVDNIFQAAPCREGGMWIACSGGLRRWSNGTITGIVVAPGTGANKPVSAVHEMADGTLAAVSNWDKVYVRKGRQWHKAPGISAARIVFDDGKEMLAFSDSGIRRVRDGSVYTHADLTPLGHVHCAYGYGGVVWLGGVNGLMRIADGRATLYNGGLPKQHQVLAITPADEDGGLWIGTDWGVALFGNGRFRLFTPSDGMPAHPCMEVLTDGRGDLWLAGVFGVMHVPIDQLMRRMDGNAPPVHPVYFDSEDGIRSYAQGPDHWSGARTVDGYLCFQGEAAITVVKPDTLRSNLVPPIVHVEGVHVDGRATVTSGRTVIAPGWRSIAIHYTALSYKAPDKIHFRYKLAGFDRDWFEAGSRRAAYYTNLPPGVYTFQVTACNEDGLWNDAGDSTVLELRPYLYETAWFRAIVTVLTLMLAWYVYRLRIRQLRRRNIELEAKVAERTKLLEDQNEELQCMQATLQEANERLEALAITDGLTGLKNRRAFDENLEREWRQQARYGQPLSLILLDIDRFKHYNDTFGHQAGDEVLKRVGKILRETARDTDFAARFGGEEFAVILPHTPPEAAVTIAERCRKAIEEQSWDLRAVTASVGVGTAIGVHGDPTSLIAGVDAALYASKNAGRNRVTKQPPLVTRSAEVSAQPNLTA